MEEWKDIVGYEKLYMVSSIGRVKGINRTTISNHGRTYNLKEKIRRPVDAGQGYMVVHLSKNGVAEQCRVNILVAKAFIPNPENLPIVMHLNDIKWDNRVDNLKWGTAKQNTIHRYEVFGYKKPFGRDNKTATPIKVVNTKSGQEEVAYGVNEISRKYGMPITSIHRHLKGGTVYKDLKFQKIDQQQKAA